VIHIMLQVRLYLLALQRAICVFSNVGCRLRDFWYDIVKEFIRLRRIKEIALCFVDMRIPQEKRALLFMTIPAFNKAGIKVVSFGRNRGLEAAFSYAWQRFGKCCQELTWAASVLKEMMC